MKILVLHGPNLNLLGRREPEIYGSMMLGDINKTLIELGKELGAELKCVQSNHEGALIDALQDAQLWANGVIFNPGGYTQTSVAIGDAVAALKTPVIEVHISNVHAREDFRKQSFVSAKAAGCIFGLGLKGYELALEWFLSH